MTSLRVPVEFDVADMPTPPELLEKLKPERYRQSMPGNHLRIYDGRTFVGVIVENKGSHRAYTAAGDLRGDFPDRKQATKSLQEAQ